MSDRLRWTEDERLVALYDVECLGRKDHRFYLELATELGVRDVADLGCGTGVLAVDLAALGLTVTAVDPSHVMIEAARRRPAGDAVTWIEGYADALPDACANLVVMNGPVAQYFLTDEDWDGVLADAFRGLQPGGYLAFESRNPAARAWERWTEAHTRTRYPHPEGGTFEAWSESVQVMEGGKEGPLETHHGHSLLPDGTHVVSEETLRFRPLGVLTSSLEGAGFTVEQVWGNWDRSALSEKCPEFVFLARRG
jgi:SAM-dependent methyltransferase